MNDQVQVPTADQLSQAVTQMILQRSEAKDKIEQIERQLPVLQAQLQLLNAQAELAKAQTPAED